MKIWRLDIVGPGLIFAVGLGLCLVGILGALGSKASPEPELDPDRARFMIECAYDWNLAPQTCREILNGEDPPPAPEYDGC